MQTFISTKENNLKTLTTHMVTTPRTISGKDHCIQLFQEILRLPGWTISNMLLYLVAQFVQTPIAQHQLNNTKTRRISLIMADEDGTSIDGQDGFVKRKVL